MTSIDSYCDRFENDGFVTIPNAIDADIVRWAHADCLKRWDRRRRPYVHDADPLADERYWDLLRAPVLRPMLNNLLGDNVYSYTGYVDVNGHLSAGERDSYWDWHVDSPQVWKDLKLAQLPRFSLKVAFWLSDVTEPGRGNMWLVPGSQTRDRLPPKSPHALDGALPVLAGPGDATFFDHRIWHTRSANSSDILRCVAFLGFAYRWMQPRTDLRRVSCSTGDPWLDQILDIGSSHHSRYHPSTATLESF